MSDLDATTPRVFLARHGETEWTISGQHTGKADIPLTALGERQVSSTGSLLVGPGKLLDPREAQKVFVSPRRRAIRTFQLLFNDQHLVDDGHTGGRVVAGVNEGIFGGGEGSIDITEEVAEWDYGEYDGMMAKDVRKLRKEKGIDAPDYEWNVWRDGCVGGESKHDIETRLDRFIDKVQTFQEPYMNTAGPANIVIVAHGLIGRCLIKRWLKMSVDADLPMMLPPGAIAILSYRDHNVKKPAFFAGMAIPAPK